jgi:hypothetical protein
MDRRQQELDRRLEKLLSDKASRRNSLLQRMKTQEAVNMAALREAGDVSARAALEACHRKLIELNLPMLFVMHGKPFSWEKVWSFVFDYPLYWELKRLVERHIDVGEKLSYGILIADIHRKLSEDGNQSAAVEREGVEVLRIVVGTLDIREAKVLFCILKHFCFPVEIVSDAGEVHVYVESEDIRTGHVVCY